LGLALGVALSGGAGCQAGPTAALAAGARPDFPDLLAMSGSEAAPLTRGQKPPAEKGGRGLLEIGPDDPGSKDSRGARIRAVVNGEAILDEEVIAAAYQSMAGARLSDEERAQLLNKTLDEIIDREVIVQDAIARLSKGKAVNFLRELQSVASKEFERQWLHRLMHANKYTDAEQFKRFLKDNGMPLELLRRSWERNFIAMEYLRTRIDPSLNSVSHRQIADYYDRHPEEFKVEDSVVWQDIFIAAARFNTRDEARRFAEGLVERARQGQDFVKLAREFDHGLTGQQANAEGIGTKRGEVRPAEVEEAVFRLKKGEVAGPIEISTGYHVVRVAKRTYAGRRPFNDDKVQKEIRDKLKGQIFQQEMKEVVRTLREKAVIDIAQEIK
jgi:parvulin-like peptidyl-prolyl isomerase